MKNLLLRLEEEEYQKLKLLKEKGGFKSWEDFFLSLINADDSTLKEMKRNKLKEKLFEVFSEAQLVSRYKSELELVRIIAVKLIDEDAAKAKESIQKLLKELEKVEEEEVEDIFNAKPAVDENE